MNQDKAPQYIKHDERNHYEKNLLNQLERMYQDIALERAQ